MQPSQLLAALADLAPAGDDRVFDVTRNGEGLAWLADPERLPKTRTIDRFAALDALHREERILRRGWGWLIGAATVAGVRRKVRLPLLAQPVRIERGRRSRLVPAGDLELTGLVEDHDVAAGLEGAAGLGTAAWLASPEALTWIGAAAEAAGLPLARVLPGGTRTPRAPESELEGYAGAALFVVREVASTGLRDTLRAWSARPGLDGTALDRVYRGSGPESVVDDDPVRSPLPLNAAQREVVRRVRTEPVVVVSGPPGNGKSHAVVAAALDTVDRGGSVLVATQSGHAADVLGALLARYPGPVPVLFGDAERREAIAVDLADGAAAGASGGQLGRDEDEVRTAERRVADLVGGIAAALDLERDAAELAVWAPLLPGLQADLPAAFAPGFDLAAAERRLATATGQPATPTPGHPSWWRRLWAAWAERRLRTGTGAGPDVGLDRVRAGLRAARCLTASARLASIGGTDLDSAWSGLVAADEALAEAIGTAMRHRAASARRWSGDARRSAAALATALRSGRNRRREALAALDGPALVWALPLWVGTVTDVEDLLPPTPGLFDLVILDEAAHIDQIRAAPVLARARRALVVGDARQLRFVSFVSDVDIAATLDRHGLAGYADRLDVRRASAYDVAAGAGAVTYLDEHYRSLPHLIEFSATRFYGDRIALVTRHPRHERSDVIDLRRVEGAEVVDGVNRREVEAVLAEVRSLAAAGETGIGVITPFRAQADALEAALLDAFGVDDIERLGLRVGTVHAFQGSEADTVVASLGLVDDDSPARHRFVSDANLFNVLVTRARRRMLVVTSLRAGGGIVGDYLAYSADPPEPADAPLTTGDDWPARLGRELASAGLTVRADYPVGRWTVDLCVGETGLICRPHPDGNEAHVERQRTLLRAGWTLRDAFASRWSDSAVRAAAELATDLKGGAGSAHV